MDNLNNFKRPITFFKRKSQLNTLNFKGKDADKYELEQKNTSKNELIINTRLEKLKKAIELQKETDVLIQKNFNTYQEPVQNSQANNIQKEKLQRRRGTIQLMQKPNIAIETQKDAEENFDVRIVKSKLAPKKKQNNSVSSQSSEYQCKSDDGQYKFEVDKMCLNTILQMKTDFDTGRNIKQKKYHENIGKILALKEQPISFLAQGRENSSKLIKKDDQKKLFQ